MNKRPFGISQHNAGAFSYALFFISGIFFFIVDRDPYVRFHAGQSIVVFGILFLLQWLLGVSVILASLVPLIGVLIFGLWLFLIYTAWEGKEWEVPVLGQFARKIVKK